MKRLAWLLGLGLFVNACGIELNEDECVSDSDCERIAPGTVCSPESWCVRPSAPIIEVDANRPQPDASAAGGAGGAGGEGGVGGEPIPDAGAGGEPADAAAGGAGGTPADAGEPADAGAGGEPADAAQPDGGGQDAAPAEDAAPVPDAG